MEIFLYICFMSLKKYNIPVICIDDSNRPESIPLSKWIVAGKPYTITEFWILNVQNRMIGVKLAEVNLDGCTLYTCYQLTRFGIPIPEMEVEAQAAIDNLLSETISEPQHA